MSDRLEVPATANVVQNGSHFGRVHEWSILAGFLSCKQGLDFAVCMT